MKHTDAQIQKLREYGNGNCSETEFDGAPSRDGAFPRDMVTAVRDNEAKIQDIF